MGRLIDIDRLCNDLVKRWSIADKKKEDLIRAVMADVVTPIVVSQPTVDAIPIDWINLFNSTPIGGDSIDDLLREWRYKQEVEEERERDEDGKNGRS